MSRLVTPLNMFKEFRYFKERNEKKALYPIIKTLIIGEDYMENIVIRDSILTNELTFQGYKPYADTWENGTVIVQTYSHMLYDLDPLDFNNHLSARCTQGLMLNLIIICNFRTVKAKMKLADYIYENVLGLEGKDEVITCGELNRLTLDYALTLASTTAVDRMVTRGRNLSFGPDNDYIWGIGLWELSGGLKWNIIDDQNVELVGSRLWSKPGFPLYPGEHYCDLLSPYRALEWIYIESIRHTMQFS